MTYLNDRVYDEGLSVLSNEVTHLTICTTEPTDFTEAWVTHKLGTKAAPTVSPPQAKSGGGREVIISPITDGAVTLTGVAGYFALVDTINSRLLVAKPLAASQSVSNLNTFTLTSFKVGIPGAI